MADDATWRLLLPRQLRELPADLAAVTALTVLAVLSVALPFVRETPLRIALGLPFVLFLPGYALIAALFPEAGEGPLAATEEGPVTATDGESDERETAGGNGLAGDGSAGESVDDDSTDDRFSMRDGRGIDGIERVALSFGLSIAVVPLLGLVLNFTPWGIRLAPILVAVGGFTLVATAVAAHRRWQLSAEERFHVPYRAWLAAGKTELFYPETRVDGVLNVVLVASILLAVGSVGFAIAYPSQGESFSELYYLTETEDGELIAADYPTEFTVGEARPLVVGIGNQEHQRTNYTVVVELQNVSIGGSNGTTGAFTRSNYSRAQNASGGPNGTVVTVHEQDELSRFSASIAHNETQLRTVQLRPTMTGEDLRVQFLLYRDGAPADPSEATAYRDVFLWVNVSSATGG